MWFVDRKSKYLNRYKITTDSGDVSYATFERADEPIVEGTPLNAANMNKLLPKPDTATVGQTFRVAEVDENGIVTKVEAVTPAAPYTYGTEDIEAGTASPHPTGTLHFIYEPAQ